MSASGRAAPAIPQRRGWMVAEYAVPAALTLAAIALRLAGIDGRGLWYDEAFSVYLARQDLADMVRLTAEDIHPPLYYALLHVWLALWGDGEAALRGLSAVLGVAGVPLAYLLGRATGGRGLGAAVAALVATSPFLVLYSQETRMYTLLFALVAAAGLFAWRAATLEPVRRWAPGYVVAGTLAAYTHNTAVLALCGFNAAYATVAGPALWRRWRSGEKRSPLCAVAAWAACQLAVAALLLPWLPVLLAQDERYVRAGGGEPLPALLSTIGRAFVVGEVPPAGSDWVGPIAWLAVVAGVVLPLRRARAADRYRLASGVSFAAVWLAVALFLLYVNSAGKRDFSPRYITVVLPAFCLLLGACLVEAFRLRRALGVLCAAGAVALVAAALQAYYQDPYDDRPDHRGPLRAFAAAARPGDVAILNAAYFFPVYEYYYRGEVPYVGLPSPAAPDRAATERALEDIAARYRRVWLFLWQDYYTDPEAVVETWLRDKQLLFYEEKYHLGTRLRGYEVRGPHDTTFGGAVRLEGYELVDLKAGWEAKVRLRWRSLAPLAKDYQVFVHLVDADYRFYGQHDGAPAGGTSPTSRWQPGDLVVDEHVVRVPESAAGKALSVRVGLYDLESGRRLETGTGDDLTLARVVVPPGTGD